MRPPTEYTKCNECGYRDYDARFPKVHGNSHEKYHKIMEKYGHEDMTGGAGVVCPKCGNYENFTYNSKK